MIITHRYSKFSTRRPFQFRGGEIRENTTNHILSNEPTVLIRVSARGAHLILGSQRGALIQGRRSFQK